VPAYRTTPRHWSTGTPWYANDDDPQPGMIPGTTMRPTAGQNAALNAHGATAQNLARNRYGSAS